MARNPSFIPAFRQRCELVGIYQRVKERHKALTVECGNSGKAFYLVRIEFAEELKRLEDEQDVDAPALIKSLASPELGEAARIRVMQRHVPADRTCDPATTASWVSNHLDARSKTIKGVLDTVPCRYCLELLADTKESGERRQHFKDKLFPAMMRLKPAAEQTESVEDAADTDPFESLHENLLRLRRAPPDGAQGTDGESQVAGGPESLGIDAREAS